VYANGKLMSNLRKWTFCIFRHFHFQCLHLNLLHLLTFVNIQNVKPMYVYSDIYCNQNRYNAGLNTFWPPANAALCLSYLWFNVRKPWARNFVFACNAFSRMYRRTIAMVICPSVWDGHTLWSYSALWCGFEFMLL